MKQNEKTYIIGVTGGIGSGKSMVAKILKENNFELIDADLEYSELMKTNKDMIIEIVNEFGSIVVDDSMNIIRTKLSEIVFRSSKSLKRLNSITHKYVVKEIEKKIDFYKRNSTKFIVLDVPIPVRVGFINECDEIWVVITKRSLRISRILKRNPELNMYEIEKRIESQMSNHMYKEIADKVIYNNDSIDGLKKKVIKILKHEIGTNKNKF